jgi:hypothetical protein
MSTEREAWNAYQNNEYVHDSLQDIDNSWPKLFWLGNLVLDHNSSIWNNVSPQYNILWSWTTPLKLSAIAGATARLSSQTLRDTIVSQYIFFNSVPTLESSGCLTRATPTFFSTLYLKKYLVRDQDYTECRVTWRDINVTSTFEWVWTIACQVSSVKCTQSNLYSLLKCIR